LAAVYLQNYFNAINTINGSVKRYNLTSIFSAYNRQKNENNIVPVPGKQHSCIYIKEKLNIREVEMLGISQSSQRF